MARVDEKPNHPDKPAVSSIVLAGLVFVLIGICVIWLRHWSELDRGQRIIDAQNKAFDQQMQERQERIEREREAADSATQC
jgi:hypothetical protein